MVTETKGKVDCMDKAKESGYGSLPLSSEYEWSLRWGIGKRKLRITGDKTDKDAKKELYTAEDAADKGRKYFVKHDDVSLRPSQTSVPTELPYVLTELGSFSHNNKKYSVSELYDGDLRDLFEIGSRLEKLFRKADSRSKEQFIAKVFLRMMFTVRAFYSCRLSNLDIKITNEVYKITGNDLKHVSVKMIDCFESLISGDYSKTAISDNVYRVSMKWLSPALFYIALNRYTEQTSLAAARFSDVYSMGILLYYLYSGQKIWHAPWDGGKYSESDMERLTEKYPERKKYIGEENTKCQYSADYKQFYYSEFRSPMMKEITPDSFPFAADPSAVADLLKKMLSFPVDIYDSPVEMCDCIIREYCDILRNSGIPLDASAARFSPDFQGTDQSVHIVIELQNEMVRQDEEKSEWKEYLTYDMKKGDVIGVPMALYRKNRENMAERFIVNDMIFLICDGENVFYRTVPDESFRDFTCVFSLNGDNTESCYGLLEGNTITVQTVENGEKTSRVSLRRK